MPPTFIAMRSALPESSGNANSLYTFQIRVRGLSSQFISSLTLSMHVWPMVSGLPRFDTPRKAPPRWRSNSPPALRRRPRRFCRDKARSKISAKGRLCRLTLIVQRPGVRMIVVLPSRLAIEAVTCPWDDLQPLCRNRLTALGTMAIVAAGQCFE